MGSMIRIITIALIALPLQAHADEPQPPPAPVPVPVPPSYWFDRVNPLDAFEVKGEELCFDDLAVRYQLDGRAAGYQATGFDFEGRDVGTLAVRPSTGPGRTCVTIRPTSSPDGYLIVRLTTMRGRAALPSTLVHLARGEQGTLRVIGLRRL